MTDGKDLGFMVYAIEVTSDGMTHTKFHDDRFRNLSNIKDITSTV
jgi:hypothetical protein